MFGLNGGYDSRPVKSGGTDTGISVTNKRTAFFQQIALNAEAVSNSWTFNAYGLLPVGDVEQKLNSFYQGGAMNTYGLDVGYFITPALHASAGYYYQHRDEEHIDGSAVRGRVAYEISDGLTAGLNVSHDFQESDHFETRVSADLKVRFGGAATTAQRKAVQQLPVINALTSMPSNRDVRVHDETTNTAYLRKVFIESIDQLKREMGPNKGTPLISAKAIRNELSKKRMIRLSQILSEKGVLKQLLNIRNTNL